MNKNGEVAGSQGFQLGCAQVDITPPVGVTLWGYNPRISTHVSHPLRAEALACENGHRGWLLLGADIGAFAAPLTDPLRAEISRRTGLPPDAVMMTATHTHSGPHVTDANWCERSALESAYFRTLYHKLADLAEQAWQARASGEILYGCTEAGELASNRRVQNDEGIWVNEFRDPEGVHTGYFDPAVDLIGIRRGNGKLDVLLVNFGCHPVAFGGKSLAISADYVGHMKTALEKDGTVGTVMFTVSGHGNIDPRDGVQSDPDIVRDIGERLACIVKQALPGMQPVTGNEVVAVQEPWHFDANWSISGRMKIYFPHAEPGSCVKTAISALRAGDLAMIGLPGETVSEYRKLIQQRSPFAHTMLISLANDFIGYLPTDDILAQGAYEANLSPLRPIQKRLLARVDAAFEKLR